MQFDNPSCDARVSKIFLRFPATLRNTLWPVCMIDFALFSHNFYIDSLIKTKQYYSKYKMYRDFSCVKNDKSLSNSKRKMFPTLLHELLSDPEYSHIVTWLPHGRSFVILNRKEFESVIIQTEFKLTKVKSFVRQLNG